MKGTENGAAGNGKAAAKKKAAQKDGEEKEARPRNRTKPPRILALCPLPLNEGLCDVYEACRLYGNISPDTFYNLPDRPQAVEISPGRKGYLRREILALVEGKAGEARSR